MPQVDRQTLTALDRRVTRLEKRNRGSSGGGSSSPPAAGVTDHGALTGLADDDHPQYETSAEAQAKVDAHTTDATDAHDAAAISSVPAGNLASTDVQSALNELDSEKAPTASAVMDGDAAGGVLGGTYPNPGFAVDMATQAELDAHAGTSHGVTDHGALGGLSDDDHPQYVPRALVDAKGDLIVATAADTVARKAVGANGTFLVADSTETDGLEWRAIADADVPSTIARDSEVTSAIGTHEAAADPHTGYVRESVVDAKGDLFVGTGADTLQRRAVGTDGQVLTADSAESDGVKWATPTSGVSDHGALSGLGDDDHPQYATNAELDTHASLYPHKVVKEQVWVATTANLDLSGTETIDGVALAGGERVLVKDQTDTIQNGIYVCNAGGAWARATDFDAASDVIPGALVPVLIGDTHRGKVFVAIGDPADTPLGFPTPGTDPILFREAGAIHEARTDAHAASSITIADSAGDFTATNVEDALQELQADAEAHLADASDAHDASAISVLDSAGNFAAADVEAALAELRAWNPLPLVKASDQSVTNSTALVDVTGLTWAIAANEVWTFEVTFVYVATTTQDIKFAFNGPTGATVRWWRKSASQTSGEVSVNQISSITGLDTSTDVRGTTGSEFVIVVEGVVRNGANAGTFAPRFAQQVAGAGTSATVKTDSILRRERVA